jgi:hypothetical protein
MLLMKKGKVESPLFQPIQFKMFYANDLTLVLPAEQVVTFWATPLF